MARKGMRLLANNMIRKDSFRSGSFDDFLFLIFLCLIFQNIIVDFTFLLSRKSSQFHLAGIMRFLKIKMQKVYKDIAHLKLK